MNEEKIIEATFAEIRNEGKDEPQHHIYVDELLWLLEDCRRIAYEEAYVTILRPIIDQMSDGIPEWLESLKKPSHIEVWSDGELLFDGLVQERKANDV